jgi:hypothetical protein
MVIRGERWFNEPVDLSHHPFFKPGSIVIVGHVSAQRPAGDVTNKIVTSKT